MGLWIALLEALHNVDRVKWIDLPPVWLAGALLIAWVTGFSEWHIVFNWVGGIVLLVAVLLMIAAVVEFRRAKTTIVPHQTPDALIDGGVFSLTRNPIYLADVLVLFGFSMIWSSWVGLGLLLPLAWVLQRRFIEKEEARLNDAFGEAFTDYLDRVRRWI